MKLVLAVLLTLATSGCALVFADRHMGKAGGDTFVLCHKGEQTLAVPREAVIAHRNHGDTYGPC